MWHERSKGAETARALGISSPTSSADALNILLGIAAFYDWAVGGADVAHAFMATPLRKRDVVIRFPLSITTKEGAPLYLHLARALNGLRKASQEWVCSLSEIVTELNLKNSSLEPCLYTGCTSKGVPVGLIVYVDDLLAIAPTLKDVDDVFAVIGKRFVLKKTGHTKPSKEGGGKIEFLGRIVARQKDDKSLLMTLPSNYLDGTLKEYGLAGKGSNNPPDIAVHLEKEGGTPLSQEAYGGFRSALGKVAWLSQTRQDLRVYVSLMASQQSSCTNHTEAAMRAFLRYLQNDMNVVCRMPARSDVLSSKGFCNDQLCLVCFSLEDHWKERHFWRDFDFPRECCENIDTSPTTCFFI